jgi:hypothetical protein
MSIIQAYKNEDIPLTLTLSDLEYGINDYDNIVVYFYNLTTTRVLTKFSINALAGYEDITVTDSANKIIDIIVPDADTKQAKKGKYGLSYRSTYTDVAYPDGIDEDVGVLVTLVNISYNPIVSE